MIRIGNIELCYKHDPELCGEFLHVEGDDADGVRITLLIFLPSRKVGAILSGIAESLSSAKVFDHPLNNFDDDVIHVGRATWLPNQDQRSQYYIRLCRGKKQIQTIVSWEELDRFYSQLMHICYG